MNIDIKTVAITGTTGGLGSLLANELASKGINLIFIDRNFRKSKKLAEDILKKYQNIEINFVTADLEDLDSVKDAVNELKKINFEILILNAGVYNVPIYKTNTGFNNVFQINFASQYILAKKILNQNKSLKKIVAVSSIAHNLSRININDIDFSNNKSQMKIYGNSKRFLMFSLYELLKNNKDIKLSIVHPGVTLTSMTSHYNKSINWLVKLGVKLFFHHPKKQFNAYQVPFLTTVNILNG